MDGVLQAKSSMMLWARYMITRLMIAAIVSVIAVAAPVMTEEVLCRADSAGRVSHGTRGRARGDQRPLSPAAMS